MSIVVDGDFPGGNILVKTIDGTRLVVAQDLRDTSQWWFWWNFRVRGAGGQTLEVTFDDGGPGPVGSNGPAMRVGDDPWQWAWHGDGSGPCREFDAHHFTVTVPEAADEVFLAFSFPYQLADIEAFIACYRNHLDLQVSVLATTRAGQRVPLLVIGDPQSAERNVLFTSRHHACESVGDFVLEGVLDFVLSTEGDALRRTTAFSIVPMVDLDGVEAGDQGKFRVPHDHNRDYIEESIYPATTAIKLLVDDLSDRNLQLFIDFHCPWIRNPDNDATFVVGSPEPYGVPQQEFSEILRQVNDSPMPYSGQRDIPFGTAWNVAEVGQISSSAYVRLQDKGALLAAFTIETSYALAEGVVVTPDVARTFGRAVGRAVEMFLTKH
jgi:zinc carboxypeptidase